MSPPSPATAGAHAGLDQILDRVDDLGVLGIEELLELAAIDGAIVLEQRRAGRGEVLHDRTEHGRLQRLPLGRIRLGDWR